MVVLMVENKEDLIADKKDEGFLHCKAIIEMLGSPKEHLEKTLKGYIEKLKENKNTLVVSEEYAKPTEVQNLFSMFVELELLVKDTSELMFFCYDYMPSSIEVIEPAQLTYKVANFNAFLNDIMAKLHGLDKLVKEMKTSNMSLERNAAKLLRNNVIIVLDTKGSMGVSDLSSKVGIPEPQLENFLEAMMKEGWIKKDNNIYSLEIKKKEEQE